MITITTFERSPDAGQGLARDTRVRWALEETGQPHDVRLLSFAAHVARAEARPACRRAFAAQRAVNAPA